MTIKLDLVNCVKDLYTMGYTSPVSGNHSIRLKNKSWMLITPSGIPRFELKQKDLVKVNLHTEKIVGFQEAKHRMVYACIHLQKNIYRKCNHTYSQSLHIRCCNICRTFSTHNRRSQDRSRRPRCGCKQAIWISALANMVSKIFDTEENVRAIIIRNHGVVTVGRNIHQACSS